MEIAGTKIPAGEPVLVLLGSANRDPRPFADPDRFDIHRDARGHLGFSHGVHHCPGAPAAGWRPRSRCGRCRSGVLAWPWTPARTPSSGAPA
ncbi:cytochrome P450 [Streptomyces indonesiensis]